MDKVLSQKSAVHYLHAPIDPFDQRMIEVGEGHVIYMEQSGNPDGQPVVVFHGGPGGGVARLCGGILIRRIIASSYSISADVDGRGLMPVLKTTQPGIWSGTSKKFGNFWTSKLGPFLAVVGAQRWR